MGCRSQFCTGGGCTPTDVSVQDWVQAFGYIYSPTDPLSQTYKDLIASAPSYVRSTVWDTTAEACMRTRALLYCNKSPGDVGTTSSASANSNILGQSVGLAATGAKIGEAVAQVAVTSTLGIVTLGLSSLIGPLLTAFQAHAKAEAAQANALNNLTPTFTEFVRKVDSAFFAGQVDASDAASAIAQAATSFASAVAPLEKQCNAFCGYDAIAMLIAKISPSYYQSQAIATPSAESANTGAVVSNGVSASGLSQSGETSLAAVAGLTVSPVSGSSSVIIIIAALAAILFISRGRAR